MNTLIVDLKRDGRDIGKKTSCR